MKTKKLELDVDFIGGQTSLTKDEEKELSNFFSQRKTNINLPKIKQKGRTPKREKVFA
jgi:hypothetical protein